MISKDKFIDALSGLDEEYIAQAVNAQAAPETVASATAATPAAAAAATAQPEAAAANAAVNSGRRRGNGRRSVIIGVVIAALCAAAGVAIALGTRYGGQKKIGSEAGGTPRPVLTEQTDPPGSGSAPASIITSTTADPAATLLHSIRPLATPGTSDPAETPLHSVLPLATPGTPAPEEPYDFTLVDFLKRVYSDSYPALIYELSYNELPTQAPGERIDTRILQRATDEFVGQQLTLVAEKAFDRLFELSEPLFVLHRDVDNGVLLDSGRLVLLLSMDLFDDTGDGDLWVEPEPSAFMYVLVAGRTDNIDSVVRLNSDSSKVYFGPITVEQVSIIGGHDYMYPFNVLQNCELFRQSMHFKNYTRPLYRAETGADGSVEKRLIRQADVVGEVGFANYYDTSENKSVNIFTLNMDESGGYDFDQLRLTYARFGLEFPTHVDDGYTSVTLRSSSEQIEALLQGYPDFYYVRVWFDNGLKWKYLLQDTLSDGSVVFKYLFRFKDEVVTVTTPVLYDTGWLGYDSLPEWGYYVQFDGQLYSVASDRVPYSIPQDPAVSYAGFAGYQRITDELRSRFADNPPFTVESYPLSEYDDIVKKLNDKSGNNLINYNDYIKRYIVDVQKALSSIYTN